VPFRAREADGEAGRGGGDARPAQEGFMDLLQSPTYTNAAQKNGCAREKWNSPRV